MPSAKPPVLLVEDDEHLRITMQEFLEDEGFSVHSAANVEGAKKIFATNRIEIVVSDIWLHSELRGGVKLLRWILGHCDIPVILFSGIYGLCENELLQEGASAFLPKPFTTHELYSTIAACMSQSPLPKNALRP